MSVTSASNANNGTNPGEEDFLEMDNNAKILADLETKVLNWSRLKNQVKCELVEVVDIVEKLQNALAKVHKTSEMLSVQQADLTQTVISLRKNQAVSDAEKLNDNKNIEKANKETSVAAGAGVKSGSETGVTAPKKTFARMDYSTTLQKGILFKHPGVTTSTDSNEFPPLNPRKSSHPTIQRPMSQSGIGSPSKVASSGSLSSTKSNASKLLYSTDAEGFTPVNPKSAFRPYTMKPTSQGSVVTASVNTNSGSVRSTTPNTVSDDNAHRIEMYNKKTSNASGSNPPHLQFIEDILQRNVSDFAYELKTLTGRVDSAIEGHVEGKNTLACTSKIGNQLLVSIETLNEKMASVQAEGTAISDEIKALREKFFAVKEHLRAELKQVGDDQSDSGEPSASGGRIAISSTREGILAGVEKVQGSETFAYLESGSPSGISEKEEHSAEKVQGMVPKSGDVVVKEVDEETAPVDDSAPSATTSAPPCSFPKTAELSSALEKECIPMTDPHVAAKKKIKALKNAESKAKKAAEKAAEAARVEAEAQKKRDLNRILNVHIQKSKEVGLVSDFDEGKAKQFLTKRMRVHEEKKNQEPALFFFLMLQNMCPLIRNLAQTLVIKSEESSENLLEAELDMFAFLKSFAHSSDAYECYSAGNTERAQQYLENFIQNYIDNQVLIRAGKTKFEGNGKLKNLSVYISEKAEKINAEHLNWVQSKQFFEVAPHSLRPDNKEFFTYAYAELATHENAIFKVDGFVMGLRLKQAKEADAKGNLVDEYIRMVLSTCTL